MNEKQHVINANTFQISEELKDDVWNQLCTSTENFLRIGPEMYNIIRNPQYHQLIPDFSTLQGRYMLLKSKLLSLNINTPSKETLDVLIEIIQYSSELYSATKTLHETYPNVLKNPFLSSTITTTTHPTNPDKIKN